MNIKNKLKILSLVPRYLKSNFTKPLPNVMNRVETVDYILGNNCSVVRIGDGEMNIIAGVGIAFQKYDTKLSSRLLEIAKSNIDNVLLCIPYVVTQIGGLSDYWSKNFTKFWVKHKLLFSGLYRLLFNNFYGDSQFTRFYFDRFVKYDDSLYVSKIRAMWENKHVLIVEGKHTKMGVGNDMFDNASSIRRVICPDQNAFDRYDEILKTVSECVMPDEIVICALGPTATVLCYDLATNFGIRSLDLGHIDIEYEWFVRKSANQEVIPGKYFVENKHLYEDGLNEVQGVIAVID